MLTASGSPLVNGASPGDAMDKPKTTRVRVLRPFLLKTVRQEKGVVIEIHPGLAAELASANKVEVLKPEVKAEPPKPEVAAAAAVVDLKPEPKGRGEKKGA